MGEVWCAHDTTIDRVVAIKMPAAGNMRGSRLDKRFRREARAAAGSMIRNVYRFYDVGRDRRPA